MVWILTFVGVRTTGFPNWMLARPRVVHCARQLWLYGVLDGLYHPRQAFQSEDSSQNSFQHFRYNSFWAKGRILYILTRKNNCLPWFQLNQIKALNLVGLMYGFLWSERVKYLFASITETASTCASWDSTYILSYYFGDACISRCTSSYPLSTLLRPVVGANGARHFIHEYLNAGTHTCHILIRLLFGSLCGCGVYTCWK